MRERVAGSLREVTIPTLQDLTTGKFQEGSAADVQLFLRCELFGEHEGLTSPQRRHTPLVEMVTSVGGRRIVQLPYGEDLPRIRCMLAIPKTVA